MKKTEGKSKKEQEKGFRGGNEFGVIKK